MLLDSLATGWTAHPERRPEGAARPRPVVLHLPFLIVVLAAVASIIGVLLLHRESSRMREEIVSLARPARDLLGEIQVAFSTHTYNLQRYLLTSDRSFLERSERALEQQRELSARLAELLDRMDVRTPTLEMVDRLLGSWNGPVDELLAGAFDPEAHDAATRERDALHAATLTAIADLRREVNASITSRLERIRTIESVQVMIAFALAVLALVAVLERTRFAALERLARDEAEQRARSEAALREAAAAVASAQTVEETVRRVAESASAAMGAEAALVERIGPDRRQVEIVSATGSCGPPLGTRLQWLRSASRRVVEVGGPVRWKSSADESSWVEPYLRGACEGGKMLAVPLLDLDTPTGSLILLRSVRGADFDGDEAERLRTFADLAALEFRRITLLAESERRRRDLERMTESRTRLIRGFSHDVKNALGAADGYAQLMEEGFLFGGLSGAQSAGVQHLRRSIGSALKLTEDLLHLAQAETGHIQIERVSTDVGAIAAEAALAYRSRAVTKDIRIDVDLQPDLPRVQSDPVRVRQVLGNLVSNAVKYTPAGGRVQVVARQRADNGEPGTGPWVCVSVVDNGPGIPPEEQSSVFEEFVRLAAEAGAGSGLGLAISQRVARALSGELTLRSEPGRGCEFTLWLPLRRGGSGGRGTKAGPPERTA